MVTYDVELVYGTPSGGVPTPISDDEDTALIATNPDHRGPEVSGLFEGVDTDEIEAFPEAARMVAEVERAAKWDVVGRCHDAMTDAGVSLATASEIMARVVSEVGLVDGPAHRGPHGTLRGGNAPHAPGGGFGKAPSVVGK